jgi:hypothetical protein
VRKNERQIQIGRAKLRQGANIKMDLQELGWGMEWIDLAENRYCWRALVNAVMNLRNPQNAWNYLNS